MKVTDIIVELYTEKPDQEVVIETPAGSLYTVLELRYERNDNRVVLVAGDDIADDDN